MTTTHRYELVLASIIQRVAPQWPLTATVAVNPYHGLVRLSPIAAARHMTTTSGNPIAGDPKTYLEPILGGLVQDEDCVVASVQTGLSITTVSELRQKLDSISIETTPLPTVIDLASTLTGMDWNGMYVDHTSDWIGCWIDRTQSRLRRETSPSLWQDWVTGVVYDSGLTRRGFHSVLTVAREAAHFSALEWIEQSIERLSIGYRAEAYLETRIRSLIGWASALATRHFNQDTEWVDHHLIHLVAIALTWDVAAHSQLPKESKWAIHDRMDMYIESLVASPISELVLAQFAVEAAERRRFLNQLSSAAKISVSNSPSVQAVFCIDVRSERIRRHIESLSDGFQTFGFAGFFGALVAVSDPTLAGTANQAPVLFDPAFTLALSDQSWIEAKQDQNRWWDAWRGFKENAISCFSYMGPMGITHLPEMIRSSLKRSPIPTPSQHHDRHSALVDAVKQLALPNQVAIAKGFIQGVGIIQFSPTILVVGHGASMVNNPHVSTYDCGACGGRSGSTNAIVICALLNDPTVRSALVHDGILIPSDTRFHPMVHNTTTDDVIQLEPGGILDPSVLGILEKAAEQTRRERGLPKPAVRANDWSELRPEWGLVNCHWFIAAPRSMTRGIPLLGRTFLHDYDPGLDLDHAILEVILTAPVTVATWINMAYNAAVWDPHHLGGGNKWRHNLTSGIGVTEGVSGDLRIGFPKQAIHDGQDWVHRPQRLGVIVRSNPESIRSIVNRHLDLYQTVANAWIHLYAIDDSGQITPVSVD